MFYRVWNTTKFPVIFDVVGFIELDELETPRLEFPADSKLVLIVLIVLIF